MSLQRSWVIVFLVVSTAASAQLRDAHQMRTAAEAYLPQAVSMLREFIRLPNNSRDSIQIKQNLAWCIQTLKKRHFTTSVIYSERVPHLFAERVYDRKLPFILFYVQVDGQPTDSAEWDQTSPYEPVLKRRSEDAGWEEVPWSSTLDPDLRLFGRSAADSKGPAVAFLSAVDILDRQHVRPAFNIKVILDFQEELGSPALPALVLQHKALLASRMVLIMDGTRHVSNLPTLNFGARGIATVTLKVFGPKTELHSGQYGNYAPNPVIALAHLLADMKDDAGRVTIPGFYNGVSLSDDEKRLINDMPGSDAALNERLGIAKSDDVGDTYEESLQYPSLNVRGLQAATVGTAVRTVIPAVAIAEIDMRLVPETSAERQIRLVRDYIASKGFHFVDQSPTEEERSHYSKLIAFDYRIGSKPFRTDLNSAMGQWLSAAMDRTFGPGHYVKQRTTGGSQPIEPFITALGIPAVSVRIPNPDNNIHAANENLRIGNLLEGIQMCLGIMSQKLE